MRTVQALMLAGTLTVSALNNDVNYKSQFGQEKFINEILFNNKRGGTFVDIGAHDGITCSNTWFFEKRLGWKGICFEPMPSIFKKLIDNRSCICINACIADQEGSVTFREIIGFGDMWSGIESNYDPRHRALIEAKLKEKGGSYRLIEIPSYTLNGVLEKNQMYHIDFLSLDIEGGELEVLKSIDFKKFYITAITVENNYKTPEIVQFLESHGFKYIQKLGVDEIFVNNKDVHLINMSAHFVNKETPLIIHKSPKKKRHKK